MDHTGFLRSDLIEGNFSTLSEAFCFRSAWTATYPKNIKARIETIQNLVLDSGFLFPNTIRSAKCLRYEFDPNHTELN